MERSSSTQTPKPNYKYVSSTEPEVLDITEVEWNIRCFYDVFNFTNVVTSPTYELTNTNCKFNLELIKHPDIPRYGVRFNDTNHGLLYFLYKCLGIPLCHHLKITIYVVNSFLQKKFSSTFVEQSWRAGRSIAKDYFFEEDSIYRSWNEEYIHQSTLTVGCKVERFGTFLATVHKIEESNDFKLEKKFDDLLNSECYSDVKFVIQKDYEFFGHKAILASASPVFKAMFTHDMKENLENIVYIDDVRQNVFGELLRYIYAGDIKDLQNCAIELLEAADKYQLDRLKALCEQYLARNIVDENAVDILAIAHKMRLKELLRVTLQYCRMNIKKLERTSSFKKLNVPLLFVEALWALDS